MLTTAMDSARATAIEGAGATRRRGRCDGNVAATEGTMGMEGAMTMDVAFGAKNGANWGNIIAEAA